MASEQDPKKQHINRYIDQSLKQVFSDLQTDDMPDQITDLLSVLRAQDDAAKNKS